MPNKIFFCIVCLFFCCIVQLEGQFISPELQWKCKYDIWDTQPTDPILVAETTRTFFFEDDTLIGNQIYNKMYYYEDSIRTLNTETSYFTSMRSTGNKVYEHLGQGSERLLYDFDMKLNDTILSSFSDVGEPYFLIVAKVDSIIMNGLEKKRYQINYFDDDSSPTGDLSRIIVEDYGDINKGPFYPHCYYTYNYDCIHRLLCIHDENDLVYDNPDFDYCYLDIRLNSDEIIGIQPTIFPNPISSKLTISLEGQRSDYKGKIIDINGRLVREISLKPHATTIDLTDLNSGIYLLSITDNKLIHWQSKLIKI